MRGNTFASILGWYFNYTNSLMLGILVIVLILMRYLFWEQSFFKINGKPYLLAEVMCVLLPTILVCSLVYYSLYILYTIRMLEVWAILTLKVVGQQWFWHYEFSNLGEGVECVITPIEELRAVRLHRNFRTTPALTLPQGLSIRVCLTSRDVIHR